MVFSIFVCFIYWANGLVENDTITGGPSRHTKLLTNEIGQEHDLWFLPLELIYILEDVNWFQEPVKKMFDAHFNSGL